MKRAAAVLLIWALAATGALAQNPVLGHFRAYQAALEQNDLPAAEAAANAALAASEARDGDGGSTPVLTLNLATVRFLRGESANALGPAQRALALAQAGGEASRVSPIQAGLLLGRVELALARDAGAARVLAALEAGQDGTLPDDDIYDAAVHLGQYLTLGADYARAHQAWSIAANYASSARSSPAYALANARVWQAASMMLEDTTREGRGRGRLEADTAAQARRGLNEAVALLQPLAEIEAVDGRMTLAQSAYAQALAWRAVLRAKIRSDGVELPADEPEAQGDGAYEIDLPASSPQARCHVRFNYTRDYSLLFPDRALSEGQLAGMAVRFTVDETGQVTESLPVAVVGRDDFVRAVENSWRHWRVERLESSPPNCRMAMTVINSMSFVIS